MTPVFSNLKRPITTQFLTPKKPLTKLLISDHKLRTPLQNYYQQTNQVLEKPESEEEVEEEEEEEEPEPPKEAS